MMDEEEFQEEEGSGEDPPTSERHEGEEGEEDEEVMEVEEQQSGSQAASGSEEEEEGAAIATPSRGRGRGRARARGGIRGRPRGRGRGGRGVGRGRARKVIVLRNPNYAASPGDSGDGASSDGETPGTGEAEEADASSEQRWFRTVEGVQYETDGEELVIPEDPQGELKIDKLGNLLGGRKFKGSTFTSAIRPNPHRRYMLSIEAARATGYRDSLYYFRRNPLLFKINLTQSEKDLLIAEKILSQNLRSRIVTMVTARTAFMMGGAKLVKDGKWVEDDYFEDKAREECLTKGAKPGDPVGDVGDNSFDDPNRREKLAAEKASQAQQAAGPTDRSAAVYKTGGPTTFFGGAGLGPFAGEMPSSRKAILNRDGVTEENWMLLMSQEVVEANQEFTKMRRDRLEQVRGSGGPSQTIPRTESVEPSRSGTPVVQPPGTEPTIAPPVEPADLSTEGLSAAALRALNMGARRTAAVARERKKVRIPRDELPRGIYEPHTGLFHYRTDTQPTRSRMERVSGPDGETRSILGGTLTGSGAWGVAWIDTYADSKDYEAEKHEEMRRLFDSLMAGQK